MKLKKGLMAVAAIGTIALSSFAANTASATLWNVWEVKSGSDGGFGFSSFHDAGGSSVMSGSSFGTISGAAVDRNDAGTALGTYNDATGFLNIFGNKLLVAGANGTTATSFTLSGSLDFGGDAVGFMESNSTLDMTLAGGTMGTPSVAATTLGFFGNGNRVCCSSAGNDAPNSFEILSGGELATLTLWGADGFNIQASSIGDAYNGSNIGMDLRLELGVVPLPAALPLYGTGLAVMGLLGWNRKRKASATA